MQEIFRIDKLLLALVGSLLMVFISAGVARAETDNASGSMWFSTTAAPKYFATERYHERPAAFKFKMHQMDGSCSGGVLGLRPYRSTGGAWMGPWVSWPSVSTYTHVGVTEVWQSPGDIPSGYFKLVGFNNSDCGVPWTDPSWFNGTITF